MLHYPATVEFILTEIHVLLHSKTYALLVDCCHNRDKVLTHVGGSRRWVKEHETRASVIHKHHTKGDEHRGHSWSCITMSIMFTRVELNQPKYFVLLTMIDKVCIHVFYKFILPLMYK